MRMTGYLDNIASHLATDRKTLAVIDRAMAEAGLRRKGSGRAIPAPTLREGLMFMLAIVGRRSVVSATDDAQAWANLPCISGRGSYFEQRQYRSLIECLEDLCVEMRKPEREWRAEFAETLMLELDLIQEQAIIAFGNEKQDHLLFEIPGIKRSYSIEDLKRIKFAYFVQLARTHRDEAAD